MSTKPTLTSNKKILTELELSRKKVEILETAMQDLTDELHFIHKQFQNSEKVSKDLFLEAINDIIDELSFTGKTIRALENNINTVIDSVFEGDSGHALREMVVQVITLSLNHWEMTTGSSKIELAEESHIWKVHLDKGFFRVRTFDRYLSLQNLPAKPRWRDVLRTARFVLTYSEKNSPVKEQLRQSLKKLQDLIFQNKVS
ncbi:MAG: hypothetical protein HQM14_19980 [SAR324 cluster bacterium]|nr:hypothetical protein [SAR324 cluster bacterium]